MTEAAIRPPVPYFGGKMRLAKRLIDLFPAHRHYVEAYAGSLAVLLPKPRAPHETVNDLDGDLVNFWRVLRERPDELARVCALTPHAREEHRESYRPTADDLERARRVWVQLTQGRAGVRTATGWRHYVDPAGSVSSMPRYLAGYVNRIAAAAERLVGVSLECRPAIELVTSYGRSGDVLPYLDPPYPPGTRSSGSYLHEMTAGDHADLLEAVTAAKASVVISSYANPMYDGALFDWHRREINTNTGQGGTWSKRVEVVWSNRPFPTTPNPEGARPA